jgi:hypothetical protein
MKRGVPIIPSVISPPFAGIVIEFLSIKVNAIESNEKINTNVKKLTNAFSEKDKFRNFCLSVLNLIKFTIIEINI